MTKKSFLLFVLIVLLLGSNVYALLRLMNVQRKLATTTAQVQERHINEKVLSFARLFIEDVLKASGEVSFENRLRLENAVRDLQDPNILSAWNTFVGSKTEREAQEGVRSLLHILVQKIKA